MVSRNNSGCTCCQLCNCYQYQGCSTCANMASRWDLSVAGLSNGTCTNCADYVGTFSLCPTTGSSCAFESPQNEYGLNTCGGTEPFYKLRKLSTDLGGLTKPWIVEAFAGATATITWGIDEGSWDCCGNNILSIIGTAGGECSGWPTTVTVSPCADVCPPIECSGNCNASTTPSTVTITLPDNWKVGVCIQCETLAGSYVLDQIADCLWEKALTQCNGGLLQASIDGIGRLVIDMSLASFCDRFNPLATDYNAINMTWRSASPLAIPVDCSTLNESVPFLQANQGGQCFDPAPVNCIKDAELAATWVS